jgi:hypothetical protein
MHIKAIKIRHIADYILEITFDNGDKGTIDFRGYAKSGGVFSSFANIEYFKQVTIDPVWGVLCWPGDVDIAPETVYQLATGKSSDECVENMARSVKPF